MRDVCIGTDIFQLCVCACACVSDCVCLCPKVSLVVSLSPCIVVIGRFPRAESPKVYLVNNIIRVKFLTSVQLGVKLTEK